MRMSSSLVAGIAVSAAVPTLGQSQSTACADVSAAVATQTGAAAPTVAAELAWDCIQSVPLNKSTALGLLDSIQPYIEWQTTLSYLKDPPPEYVEKIQPPVDVRQGWEEIRRNVSDDVWDKEYDFGLAIYHLWQITHDGHFAYFPDVVNGIFGWRRSMPIVSVSEDGQKLPSIFAYSDMIDSIGNSTGFTPSAIKTIDGQDAIEWLLQYLEIGSLQDRDALWNNIFFSLGQAASGSGTSPGTFAGAGRGGYVYHGPTTTIGFANGTTKVLHNHADVLVDFAGIKTGEDLYEKFFAIPAGDAVALATSTSKEVKSPAEDVAAVKGTPWAGYPKAIERHSNNVVAGYYVPGSEYDDIAVLAMPSFSSSTPEFQKVVEDFLADAKAAGKKKLIVDLSANNGGTILQGYDVFKQLFPSIEPLGWTRFRASEALNEAGITFSRYDRKGYPRNSSEISHWTEYLISAVPDRRRDVTKRDTHFKSWNQKFGPHERHGDNFTSIIRWDLNDPLIVDSSGGIIVTGYQSRSNYTEQPFAAEDVVMVYDGYCASTCTIFSQMMRDQAGVEAIALGGRPSHGEIQAVGGVKGTNNYDFGTIQNYMNATRKLANKKESEEWKELLDAYQSNVAISRSVATSINVRDGLRKGDKSQTPTHFIYEPADCRVLYTPDMLVDASAIWKAAADSKWGGTSRCVAGSVGGNERAEAKEEKSERITVKTQMSSENVEQLREASTRHAKLSDIVGLEGVMFP